MDFKSLKAINNYLTKIPSDFSHLTSKMWDLALKYVENHDNNMNSFLHSWENIL